MYGPQEDAEKIVFMQELREIRDLHAGPWMLSGDFNLIADPSDKSNDRINRQMMGRFRRCISDLDMHEVYLNGRRYTWSNKRTAPTLEKLDRVLVSGVGGPIPSIVPLCAQHGCFRPLSVAPGA